MLGQHQVKRKQASMGSCIKHDLYDEAQFDKMLDANPALREVMQLGRRATNTFPALIEDTFHALFKTVIEFKNEKDINMKYRYHAPIVKALTQSYTWNQVKAHCTLDAAQSADVSALLMNSFIARTKSDLESFGQAEQDARNQAKELESLFDERDNAGSQVEREFAQDRIDEIEEKLAANLEQMEESGQAIAAAAGILPEQLDTAVEAIKLKDTMASSQGFEPGTEQVVDGENRMELAARIMDDPKLREIFHIVGRLFNLAVNKQKCKQKHPFGSVAGITLSDELSNMLPIELIQLADDEMETLFFIKYFEKQLYCFEFEERVPLGKGPIVICMDESGSMSGRREIWAKAITLALVRLARHENRDAFVICFSECVKRSYEFKTHPLYPRERLLEFASIFKSGGTNFMDPLERALRQVDQASEFKDADIVFITDGCAHMTLKFIEHFMDEKKRLEFELFSLVITPGMHFPSGLKAISDHYMNVGELDEAAANLVFDAL